MNKILVADDDLDILTLVKLALTMNQFVVKAVHRWQDINQAIIEFQPNLLLLDVSLGGADGRDICKQIKQNESLRHIPVVLFSANSEMGNSVQDCQAQDFIAKPFELSHLINTINLYLV